MKNENLARLIFKYGGTLLPLLNLTVNPIILLDEHNIDQVQPINLRYIKTESWIHFLKY